MNEFWLVDELMEKVKQLEADCDSYSAYIEILENRVWELESKCQDLDSQLEEERRLVTFGEDGWAYGR